MFNNVDALCKGDGVNKLRHENKVQEQRTLRCERAVYLLSCIVVQKVETNKRKKLLS